MLLLNAALNDAISDNPLGCQRKGRVPSLRVHRGSTSCEMVFRKGATSRRYKGVLDQGLVIHVYFYLYRSPMVVIVIISVVVARSNYIPCKARVLQVENLSKFK